MIFFVLNSIAQLLTLFFRFEVFILFKHQFKQKTPFELAKKTRLNLDFTTSGFSPDVI